MTLYDLLPKNERPTNDLLLERFLQYVQERQLELYPAQEAAILELFEEKSVILNTPTGSGKSLVAAALHFKSLAQGRRSVYTCPIKALVNEKWMALCKDFGAQNVGLSTGDATVNRHAPILCCTAEILSNIALHEGERATVRDVVMDEFHYYSDRDRGGAWQIPLLTLPQCRFLLMSATLGETDFFENQLKELTGQPAVTVKSTDRPVPLEFSYVDTPLAQTVENLATEGKCPVYIVHFTQADAGQSAQDFTSINVATKEEKASIAHALEGVKFNTPYGPDIKRWLRHGIGVHHAGLLPKYRILIEQLAQQNLLKIICGTDTLGVGVNVPIRTVLFTRLCKYDGEKTAILSARDFHQISGRAGRKGFDNLGWVVVQAPDHVIENQKLEEKSKGKKFVKRKPPEKNYVSWDKKTFERLISAPPEPLQSRFHVSHAMLLNVLSRPGDSCRAMRDLIQRTHESAKAKKHHVRRAWQLFRSLVDRKIIEIHTKEESGGYLRVNVDLQEDFSMDQTLSLYLLDTLPLLDRESPNHALDLLTLVESILENPDFILRRQLDKLKSQRIAELKMEGADYYERMEELDKLEHPKPNREFIYSSFNAFTEKHPWVGQENIRPKSIAREMFETFRTFTDYVREYDLHRAEGLLLRHLSSVHKTLKQTVPDSAKTEPVQEMELYLGAMIRQVDSSLIEEWERLQDPAYQSKQAEEELRPPGAEEAANDITRDTKSFTALMRNKILIFLRMLISADYADALDAIPPPDAEWTAEKLSAALNQFHDSHQCIRLDPEGRNARHTYIKKNDDQRSWSVQQMLIDPDEHNDWVAEFTVDLPASKEAKDVAITFQRLGPLT